MTQNALFFLDFFSTVFRQGLYGNGHAQAARGHRDALERFK
jgi:hypothetical protein